MEKPGVVCFDQGRTGEISWIPPGKTQAYNLSVIVLKFQPYTSDSALLK